MSASQVVRVAAIQASPVILDAEATVEKAVGLIGQAADRGADLAVFPECFVSFYPDAYWDDGDSPDLWERFYASAVQVSGPLVDRLIEACRTRDIHVVIGVNEREPARHGSVYNTMLILGPDGVLLRHRKLMPTHHERLWHTFGSGDDLGVVALPFARVGGLTCWENRMPLARYAVYRQHPQIWVAPTADCGGTRWDTLMGAIAVESGAYVVSACVFQPQAAFPADFPVTPQEDLGTAAIFEPERGQPIVEPILGREAVITAECDLAVGTREKRMFDVAGHYSREDVLLPLLTRW